VALGGDHVPQRAELAWWTSQARPRRAQDQSADAARRLLGDLLGNDAAEGHTEHIDLGEPQFVEQLDRQPRETTHPAWGNIGGDPPAPGRSKERWVTTATENGLAAASVGKYHTMLHSIFQRALRDRVVTFNPCEHTELSKRVKKTNRTLTPEEYDAILAALPAQHRLMVETAINTGLRWGELIALKPRHLDLSKRKLTVEETVVEVSTKNSPTGDRMLTKPYPRDNKPRVMGPPPDLADQLGDWITSRGLEPGDLMFATRDGTPISRNTFRTPVWRPAIKASGVDFDVRVHVLRHAPTPPGCSRAAPESCAQGAWQLSWPGSRGAERTHKAVQRETVGQ